jgi:hypothetical protein
VPFTVLVRRSKMHTFGVLEQQIGMVPAHRQGFAATASSSPSAQADPRGGADSNESALLEERSQPAQA